jgi:hypothetical protein
MTTLGPPPGAVDPSAPPKPKVLPPPPGAVIPAAPNALPPPPGAVSQQHGGKPDWAAYQPTALPTLSKAGEAALPAFYAAADRYHVPRGVMHAVGAMESLFTNDPAHAGNPNAGAYGWAQIEKTNIDAIRKGNPHFDPTNLQQAADYLARQLASNYKQFKDWGLAAGAYNAGSGAIDQWITKHGGDLATVNADIGENQDVRDYMLRARAGASQDDAAAKLPAIDAHRTLLARKRLADASSEMGNLLGAHAVASQKSTLPGAHATATGKPTGQPDSPDVQAANLLAKAEAEKAANPAAYERDITAARTLHAQQDASQYADNLAAQNPATTWMGHKVQGPITAFMDYAELLGPTSPFAGASLGQKPDVPSQMTLPPLGNLSPTEYEAKYGPLFRAHFEQWKHGPHHDPHVAAAEGDVAHALWQSIVQHNPSILGNAEERYSVGSRGYTEATTLDAQGKRVTPTSGDYISGAILRSLGDMAIPGLGEESVIGGGLRLAVGASARAALRIPAVARAVERSVAMGERIRVSPVIAALERIPNKTVLFRQVARRLKAAGIAPNADPANAQVAARAFGHAKMTGEQHADEIAQEITDGTTAAQDEEIERIADGSAEKYGRNLAVPQPAGASLEQRANQLRYWLDYADDQQIAAKLIEKKRMVKENYVPRAGAPGQAYKLPENDLIQSWREMRQKSPGIGKGSASAAIHRHYDYVDDAKNAGVLSSNYSLADNIRRHLTRVGDRVAMESAFGDMLEQGLGHKMTYRHIGSDMPIEDNPVTGKTARETAQGIGEGHDRLIATTATLKQLGVTGQELRQLQRANPVAVDRLYRKLADVQAARKSVAAAGAGAVTKASGLETGLTKRALAAQAEEERAAGMMAQAQGSKASVKVPDDADAAAAAQNYRRAAAAAQRAGYEAFTAAKAASGEATEAAHMAATAKVGKAFAEVVNGGPLEAKEAALLDAVAKKKVASFKLAEYNRAFEKNLTKIRGYTFGKIEGAAKAEEAAKGFVPAEELAQRSNIHLPSLGPMFAYDKDIAAYIVRHGATQEEARGFSRVLTGIDNMYRAGIVFNFVRHPFINLPIKFLASGGSIGHLLTAYGGRDEAMFARLEAASGTIPRARRAAFGGSSKLAFDTPLMQVPKDAFARAADKGKAAQYAAAGGETLNAALSRVSAWNSHIVFGWAEDGMKTQRFAQYVEEGYSDAEAANKVSQLFDGAEQIDKGGLEFYMNRAMLFYPWLRSTVPVMAMSLVRRPGLIWTPYARSYDFNKAMGDPRAESDPESTAYMGQHGGKDFYLSDMGPGKYLEDLLQVFDPSGGDTTAGISPRIQKISTLLQDELKPSIGVPLAGVLTSAEPPQEPGAPNFETMWDKAAPPQVQGEQAAQQLLLRAPFAQDIAGVLQSANQVAGGNFIPLLNALTINPYSRPSAQVEKRQYGIFNSFVRQSNVIEKRIRNAPTDKSLTPVGVTLTVTAQRLLQKIDYANSRMKSQLADGSISPADAKALRIKTQALVAPMRAALTMLYAKINQYGRVKTAPVTQATPTPTASPIGGLAGLPPPPGAVAPSATLPPPPGAVPQ